MHHDSANYHTRTTVSFLGYLCRVVHSLHFLFFALNA